MGSWRKERITARGKKDKMNEKGMSREEYGADASHRRIHTNTHVFP